MDYFIQRWNGYKLFRQIAILFSNEYINYDILEEMFIFMLHEKSRTNNITHREKIEWCANFLVRFNR